MRCSRAIGAPDRVWQIGSACPASSLFLEATQLKTVRTVTAVLRADPYEAEAQAVGIASRRERRPAEPVVADVPQSTVSPSTKGVAEARGRVAVRKKRGISKGDVSPSWIIFLPTFWIMPKSRSHRGLSGEEERESFNPQSSTAPQAKRKRFSRTESPPGSRVKSAARFPPIPGGNATEDRAHGHSCSAGRPHSSRSPRSGHSCPKRSTTS